MKKLRILFCMVNVVVISCSWVLITRPGDQPEEEITVYVVTDPNGVLPDVLIFDCADNGDDERWLPDDVELLDTIWEPDTAGAGKTNGLWYKAKGLHRENNTKK